MDHRYASSQDEGSFLGLGFSQHNAGEGVADNPVQAVDDLMKHYLQQCLDYHDEQMHQTEVNSADENHSFDVPQFIAGQVQEGTSNEASYAANAHSDLLQRPPAAAVTTATASSDASTVESTVGTPSLEAAVAKARSIVQKFQQPSSSLAHPSSQTPFPPTLHLLPTEYRQRRQQQFLKEHQRLEAALKKNFAYVARKEEERLQLQLRQLEQTRQLELELRQQHAQQLMQRQQQQQQQQRHKTAGIGTAQRRRIQKQSQRIAAENDDSTMALYLSGLPVDGSVTEETLRQLFGSYGTVRRIHFYRHKQTQQLKGDGLVVYDAPRRTTNSSSARQELVTTVCSQLNGAELPCGSILHVEPAKSEYGTQPGSGCTDGGGGSGRYGPMSTTQSTREEEMKEKQPAAANEQGQEDGTEEDLDDFFASLE